MSPRALIASMNAMPGVMWDGNKKMSESQNSLSKASLGSTSVITCIPGTEAYFALSASGIQHLKTSSTSSPTLSLSNL